MRIKIEQPPTLACCLGRLIAEMQAERHIEAAAAGLDVDVRDRPSPLVFGTVG